MYYLNAFPGKAFEIDGADPNTFRVLNADFECTADASAPAIDKRSSPKPTRGRFRPTGPSPTAPETSISFAE